MQLPGLLVEYLINGSVALIWLLPLLLISGYSPRKDDAVIIALFVPGLYVLGMIIDFIGWFILRFHKRRIKRSVYREHNVDADEIRPYAVETKFLVHAPELAKASQMRSSRDRIARGTVVNAILVTVVLTTHFGLTKQSFPLVTSIASGLAVTLVCWAMWARYQRLSYLYEVQGLRIVKEKPKDNEEAAESADIVIFT